MIAIALGLGFLGSLHCVGMCGPLALSYGQIGPGSWNQQILKALEYNLGRVLMYSFLGLILGSFGEMILGSGIQNYITIGAGLLLILLFLSSLSLEQFFWKSSNFRNIYAHLQGKIYSLLDGRKKTRPLMVGLVNGILPCGLVYIALAGAFSQPSAVASAGFMALFGLGTFPAMFAVMISGQWLNATRYPWLRKVFPYAQLAVGVFLIYRGVAVGLPSGLEFNLALESPEMCH